MKAAVLGSGAMGCLFGAALHRAGAAVSLIDVNEVQVDAINERGLELETRSGIENLPIPACLPSQAKGPFDLVLVFTKTFHTDAALDGIAHAIAAQTHLLSLQNGLGNDRRLARAVARDRVLIGASMLPADLLGPGQVRSHGDGLTRLYPAFGSDSGMAARIADTLNAGGLPTELDEHIDRVIWSKAIFNAAINPLCALTRRPPGFLGASSEARETIRSVVQEGVAVAHASKVTVDGASIHALAEGAMTNHADHEPSMLQDIKAGRRTEVDAINGAIVQAARGAGLAAPVIETLWHLVRLEESKLDYVQHPLEPARHITPD